MYKLYEEYADVKLVAYTQPDKEFVDYMTTLADDDTYKLENAQDLVAFCARVSNPGHQSMPSDSNKLIDYLTKNSHWSPLGMVDIVVEINTTRDIGRQIIRHVSFDVQEFSQRYEDVTKSFDGRGMQFVLREARRQDEKNRQNSIDDLSDSIKEEWLARQTQLIQLATEHYKWAISNKIAKECARVVLPEGNTTSRLYFKGSIRSWIHYISLRSGSGTQLEHMLIANMCAEAISKVFPKILQYAGDKKWQ